MPALSSARLDRPRGLGQQRGIWACDLAVAHDLAERLDAEGLCSRLRGDDDGGPTVGDLRGVPRGDVAGLVERGPEACERLDGRAGTHALVGVEQDRVALPLRDLDRNDLVGELAVLDGRGRALVRLGREVVLWLACDVGRCRVLLRGAAHGHLVERAEQSVEGARVDQGAVAVAVPGSGLGKEVRRLRHRLHATGNDDLGVTCLDHLVRQVDGVEAGEAHLVDRCGRNGHRDAGVHCGLPGGDLSGAGLQHLTHEDVVDLLRREPARARGRP